MTRFGFSLIELMVYLALFGIISIGVMAAYSFFLNNSSLIHQRASLSVNANNIFSTLQNRFASFEANTALCRIAPNITLPQMVTPALASIAIEPNQFEPHSDILLLDDASLWGAVSTYRDGNLTICASAVGDCATPDLTATRSLNEWQQILRHISYRPSATPHHLGKTFNLVLGSFSQKIEIKTLPFLRYCR